MAPRAGSARRAGHARRVADTERGSATVEFALVMILLLFVVLALIQLVLAVHVRAIVIDSAAEGARRAAMLGSSPAAGERLTRALITSAIDPSYPVQVSVRDERVAGLDVVTMRVRSTLPLVGLLGPRGLIDVSAHAVREEQFLVEAIE
ncbi:MAG: TadE/TadG family type IV pilus assembly protein [Bowdeniella nasicola]|nr:TadE/TadG family type IV pilus assembly protein [Bowdeniella nasicola]